MLFVPPSMPFMVPEAEAQNNSTASDPNYDTTPPVVTVPADINLNTTNSQGWVRIFNSDSSGVWSTDEAGVASFSCNFPSGNLYPIGTTTVTCTASDASGNQTTESFNVTVNYMATDNIAPVFSSIYWSDRSSPDDRYYFTEVYSWPYSSNPPLNDVVVAEDSSGYDYSFSVHALDGFYQWSYSLAEYDNQGFRNNTSEPLTGISCSGLSGLQSYATSLWRSRRSISRRKSIIFWNISNWNNHHNVYCN